MEQLTDTIREEVWERFEKYSTIYLATIDGDGPRVRPVTLVHLDSKFWILTGKSDAKIQQIKQNPRIEFTYNVKKDENTGYIRGGGKLILIEDKETKVSIAERVKYFQDYWQSLDDPNYALLEVQLEEIEYMRPGEMITKKYKL